MNPILGILFHFHCCCKQSMVHFFFFLSIFVLYSIWFQIWFLCYLLRCENNFSHKLNFLQNLKEYIFLPKSLTSVVNICYVAGTRVTWPWTCSCSQLPDKEVQWWTFLDFRRCSVCSVLPTLFPLFYCMIWISIDWPCMKVIRMRTYSLKA